jgi:RimJ/RimL family protein N-acetyltransferase
MEIFQARESDIIEALYIIKSKFDSNNVSKNYWRPPLPDYDQLRTELENNSLFMIRKNHISIGTLTFSSEKPENSEKINWQDKSENDLTIKRIAIAENWANEEVKTEVKNFIDQYARENNYKSVKLCIYRSNTDMNDFYKELGFTQQKPNENFESLLNYYEKLF